MNKHSNSNDGHNSSTTKCFLISFLKFAEQKSNAVSNSDTKTAGTKIGSSFYGD